MSPALFPAPSTTSLPTLSRCVARGPAGQSLAFFLRRRLTSVWIFFFFAPHSHPQCTDREFLLRVSFMEIYNEVGTSEQHMA